MSDKELCMLRNPKKSSKNIPEIMDDVKDKDNERWLSKRYPSKFEKMPMLLNLLELVGNLRTRSTLKGAIHMFLHLCIHVVV